MAAFVAPGGAPPHALAKPRLGGGRRRGGGRCAAPSAPNRPWSRPLWLPTPSTPAVWRPTPPLWAVASADGADGGATGEGAGDASDAAAGRRRPGGGAADEELTLGGSATPAGADGEAEAVRSGGADGAATDEGAAADGAEARTNGDEGGVDADPLSLAGGNWRRFRASLVCGGEAAFAERCREHPQGYWAHAVSVPEVGAVVVNHPAVVTPNAPYMNQAVVFLTAHVPDGDTPGAGPAEPVAGGGSRRFPPPAPGGTDLDAPHRGDSWGVLLNRPLSPHLGNLADHPSVRRSLTAAGVSSPADLSALASVPIYLGGGDSAPVVLDAPPPPPPPPSPPPSPSSGVGGRAGSPPGAADADALRDRPPTSAAEAWGWGIPPPSAAAAFSADGAGGRRGGDGASPPPVVLTLLTGLSCIPHTHPIIPGVYGGSGRAVAAAAAAVRAGGADPSDLRLFWGAVRWPRGGLVEAVEAGEVFLASCCGEVVSKQCIGLPVPLWREVMEAMGDPFRKLSRHAYGEL